MKYLELLVWPIIIIFIYYVYGFSNSSDEIQYLYYSIIGIFTYLGVVTFLYKQQGEPKEDYNFMFSMLTLNSKYLYKLYLSEPNLIGLLFFFGPFVLGIVLSVIFWFLNYGYFFVALYFLITFWVFVSESKKKLINLFAFIVLVIALYFGFKARNIFKFDLKIIYNNEVIL